jgi:iron-sulfur cluster assembly protein
MITISENAKNHLLQLMEKEGMSTKTHNLRVGVVGGGCSGLSYEMDFDSNINSSDELFEDKGIKILIDKKSLLYLYGTELEFSNGLNGKGFQFINPNASRTCGCGESFAV